MDPYFLTDPVNFNISYPAVIDYTYQQMNIQYVKYFTYCMCIVGIYSIINQNLK